MTQSPIAAASHLLETKWSGRLPIDPVAIAESLGAVVKPDRTIAPASGSFCYENGVPVIRYNPADPVVRQRFTIAHEIGHMVLGHVRAGELAHRDTSFDSSTPIEVAANAFAAQLLMPANVVPMVMRLLPPGQRSAAVLARKLWVSEQAMGIRLNALGIN
ncbi:ImmA/IrrE family metallo-endopeptidase [Pseudomonas plecoglossicida]|uniref:ImmA/IrrE family metallo-endopeptidase n=1 Tax=Pseudomonas plecoglossicida TaxID=70775 RepID=A0A2A3MBU1_PSEDL|nr:ImmA/IrrE family metallo-endopeptidase [Pseudomonas plecoglossicida]PBJ97566.1 ImmA/IrrE family metallo-endopeptidase [Pseudomonas plecoglossicida]